MGVEVNNEENDLALKRRERIERMRQEKERQERMRALIEKYGKYVAGGGLALVLVVVLVITSIVGNHGDGGSETVLAKANEETLTKEDSTQATSIEESSSMEEVANLREPESESAAESTQAGEAVATKALNLPMYEAHGTSDTKIPGEEVVSSNAIFIDLATDTILEQRNYKEVISPASMTKILTVLVAAEHISEEQLEDTFTMTVDITDYCYVNDCSVTGFEVGEEIPVKDLFYGTILPSGADAAIGLATYVSGSQEAFVELMNEKLEELGLADTAHFTNCIGLYDEDHHCSVYDMAMILEAAIENELCKEVLSAHTYTTSSTSYHPEGITISNWFLRRIEDKDTGGEVICAKTGFVNQSGNCAASYGIDNNGNEYICVTAGSTSSWRCIYDHVELYNSNHE